MKRRGAKIMPWKMGYIFIFILFVCIACQGKESQEVEEALTMDKQLFQAVEAKDRNSLLQALEDGAHIDVTDEKGATPVLLATDKNEPELVRTLIEKGADIDLQDDNQDNVLLHASAEGYEDIVKLAIEAEADTTITNRFGGTGLIPAADRGHVDIVQYLLEKSDVNIDHVNNLNWTALLEAVILGDGGEKHQQIVQLLIDHGADVHIADGEGVTPLEHARQLGYTEIEAILTEAEAKSQ